MSDSSQQLDDVSVAIFVASAGSEEVEFTEPREAVTDAGADVTVVGPETGDAELVNNDLEEGQTVEIEETFEDVSTDDFDALVIPGGTVGADRIRLEDEATTFIEEHVAADKPVGVICHGPWTLVEAGVVDGLTLTSFPSLETDIRNAGGEWVDEEVVTDQRVVTSRKPDDLSAFCETIVEEFADAA